MFIYKIDPRFSETDALGHINNTALPIWFEQGRTGIFEIFNPGIDLNKWNLILKKMDIDFVDQIFFGYQIEVRSTVKEIRNTSFVVNQEIWQKSKLAATCVAVIVHFDFQIQQKKAIPEDIRAKLLEHQ